MRTHHIERWRRIAASLLILVAYFVPVTVAQARPLSESDVRAAAETWIRYVTAGARPNASVERLEPFVHQGVTVAFVAHLSGGGYCICGADDALLPVYLYTPGGAYDPAGGAYRPLLDEIGDRLLALRAELKDGDQRHAGMIAERSALWQGLIAGDPSVALTDAEAQASPPILELPFKSCWDQISPYNDMCPTLPPASGNHCITGCNSTAGAQIMYYWRWPWQGVGTASVYYQYRWRNNWDSTALAVDPGISPPVDWAGRLEYSSSGTGWLKMNGYWDGSIKRHAETLDDDAGYQTALTTLYDRLTRDSTFHSANFGVTTYDWNLMEDRYPASPAANAEVAKLMYHLGIGIETTYGLRGTGATFEGYDPAHRDLVEALRDFFWYDSDLLPGYGRDLPQQTAFIEDMQWYRPVAFGGGSEAMGGGHAWVLYGYNTTTFPTTFNMRIGWGDTLDHWSTLDTCLFPENNDYIIRIAPRDVVKFVGAATAGDGSPAEPYQNIAAALAGAPDGATLIFKAGSVNTYTSPTLAITRPLILKGKNIAIMKQ